MSCLVDSLMLQMHLAELPEPEQEIRFWPGRRFAFDLGYIERKIAIEVEGGQWTNGAHQRGGHYESDCIKYSKAAILGWTVIRVTTNMVADGRALALVQEALEMKR